MLGVAGDIVSLTGCSAAAITHTIADPSVETPLAAGHIDPPTLRSVLLTRLELS